MSPSGLAIILGAGPNTGTGIARILSHPSHGNLAVALLARTPSSLASVKANLASTAPGGVVETFTTDTSPEKLHDAFTAIRAHPSFKDLKLRAAIFSIKHSSKKPFLEETYQDFTTSLTAYVGGAFAFAQESLRLLFEHHGEAPLADANPAGSKKGTLIFTGTLGALRANAEYGAYGAGRAGVRQLAQSLAREMSSRGVHVVHTIANGGIRDEDSEEVRRGVRMSAEQVGKTYLWLCEQPPALWTHELDLRPAQEKF